MDISKIKNMSAKSMFLLAGLTIIVLVILWGLMGYSQSQLGLSGSVSNLSQPSFAPEMMRDVSYREGATGVAYNTATTKSVPQMMPSPIRETSAPAGISKIIKSGDLDLLVKSVDEAAGAIGALRVGLGGQPGDASFSEYGSGGKRGDMTIWVPSEKFDEAMASIKKLALRVNNERVSVQDVSAQFVDLESRLRNLKVAEAQYLEIMKRSGKISEVLDVTRALTDTRAQIEQAQGQMDYLSRQVALSSIHVSLTQEAIPGAAVSSEWRPMTVVKAAAKQALSNLTQFIDQLLALVIGLPVLLLQIAFWGYVIYAFWRLGRFVHARLRGPTLS